jgi:hypothetical protein
MGFQHRNFAEVADAAQTEPGLEGRSRDKLSSLWPFAVHYGVQRQLAVAAARLEQESSSQMANSDKGLVANAIGAVIAAAGGCGRLKASDLELVEIQRRLERLLIENGEFEEYSLGDGEKGQRIDMRRYGPRDFTARIIKELGLRIRTVSGRARLDLHQFLSVWPSVSARYTGNTTLDEYAEAPATPQGLPSGSAIPPTPPLSEGSRRDSGGMVVGSSEPSPVDVSSSGNGGVGGVPGSARSSYSTGAGPGIPQKPLMRGLGPFVEYPNGTVTDRVSGAVLWRPGDDPVRRPRNPPPERSDKPRNSKRGL